MFSITIGRATKSFINKAAKFTESKGTIVFELVKDTLFLACLHNGVLLCRGIKNKTSDIPDGTIFAVPALKLKKLLKGKSTAILVFEDADKFSVCYGDELPEKSPEYDVIASILGSRKKSDIIGDTKIHEKHKVETIKNPVSILSQHMSDVLSATDKKAAGCRIAPNHIAEWFAAIKTLSVIGGSISFGQNKYFSSKEIKSTTISKSVKEIEPIYTSIQKKPLFCQEFSMAINTTQALRRLLSEIAVIEYRFLSDASLMFSSSGMFIIASIEEYADTVNNFRCNANPECWQQLAMITTDFKALLAALERGSVSKDEYVHISACKGLLMLEAKSESGETVIKSKPYKSKKNSANYRDECFSYFIKFAELQKITKIHIGRITVLRLFEQNKICSLSILNERNEVTVDFTSDHTMAVEFIDIDTNKAAVTPGAGAAANIKTKLAAGAENCPYPNVMTIEDAYKLKGAVLNV